MATKHKPKKSRKARSRKGSRRRGGKGLSGTGNAKQTTKQALASTGKRTGGNLLGLLIVAAGSYGLNKIQALQPNPADGGFKAFLKKSAKPVLFVTLGGVGGVLVRKKMGDGFVASVADGVAVGGAFSGVSAIAKSFNLEIFSGLGATDEQVSKAANYYQENLEALQNAMKENGQLVALKGADESSNNEIAGPLPGQQLDLQASNQVL